MKAISCFAILWSFGFWGFSSEPVYIINAIDNSIMRYENGLNWKKIDKPGAVALSYGGGKLYSVYNDNSIYTYQGSGMIRKWVGLTVNNLAADGNTFYCINTVSEDIWKIEVDKSAEGMTYRAGALQLLVTGHKLYYVDRKGNVHLSLGKSGSQYKWRNIGNGFKALAGTGGNLIGLKTNGDVQVYNGSWQKIGSNAAVIEASAAYAYKIDVGSSRIYRRSFSSSNWQHIGERGLDLLASGNDIYCISKDPLYSVYKYTGRNLVWNFMAGQAAAFAHYGRSTRNPFTDADVHFGWGQEFDSGTQGDVALAGTTAVSIHSGSIRSSINSIVGQYSAGKLQWGSSSKFDNGVEPSVSITASGLAVETHRTSNVSTSDDLFYHVGTVNTARKSISWGSSHKFDKGRNPSIAVNGQNWVVRVHQTYGGNDIYYNVGTVNASNKTITWKHNSGIKAGSGLVPSVALNDNNIAVLVYQNKGNLEYRTGSIYQNKIAWTAPEIYKTGATNPNVALDNQLKVVSVHNVGATKLHSMVGRVVPGYKVYWQSDAYFDDGIDGSVDLDNGLAVQTHKSEHAPSLYASASPIIDRSNWMRDLWPTIKNRKFKQIVFPGCHDAGMYLSSGLAKLGETQDRNLYGQLQGGVRFFDLRPKVSSNDFYIFHGPITGPKVKDVLNDVARYMHEGHRELVVLKFSHFKGFNNTQYKKFAKLITDTLGNYLLPKPARGRIADQTMASLIGERGRVLAVCDNMYPVNNPVNGILVYRDGGKKDPGERFDPAQGDLTIYDMYANTKDLGTMVKDQTDKFNQFNGICWDNRTPCDMFLLSWTLTPFTNVWGACPPANRALRGDVYGWRKNSHGKIANIVYVDYFEYAHVTDLCIHLNKSLSF